MEKNEKSSIFILNIDEEGRKIYTSQSDPSKRYMLDDDGNLTECSSDVLMHTIKMESDYELSADSTSNDGILVGDSDCIIAQLQNAGGLGNIHYLPTKKSSLFIVSCRYDDSLGARICIG